MLRRLNISANQRRKARSRLGSKPKHNLQGLGVSYTGLQVQVVDNTLLYRHLAVTRVSRDDFAHTHINDIGFIPVAHSETGEMGFNVVLGGYMSIKRVAESVHPGEQ